MPRGTPLTPAQQLEKERLVAKAAEAKARQVEANARKKISEEEEKTKRAEEKTKQAMEKTNQGKQDAKNREMQRLATVQNQRWEGINRSFNEELPKIKSKGK